MIDFADFVLTISPYAYDISLLQKLPADICVNLANDIQYLQTLRETMRNRMQASALLDRPTFTLYLEANYQERWDNWCVKSPTA